MTSTLKLLDLRYSFESQGKSMTKTIHGKVHGKIIELDENLGVADGQDLEVKVVSSTTTWGESLRRCAGRRLLLIGFHRRMASSIPALASSLDKVAARLRHLQRG